MDLTHIFHFLIDLKFNNNRKWFEENKSRYLEAKETFEALIDELIVELRKIDPEIDVTNAKECIFRIYRDVRFSKNKEPYKTNFGASIVKGGRKSPNAGYYIHFEPDNSFIGGGIYMPPAPSLKSIRTSIYNDPKPFKSIIEAPKFKKTFGGIYGEKLKRAHKGFPHDFEFIDLINHKHYAVIHPIENEFWKKENVTSAMIDVFKVQLPLNNYLNQLVRNN